MVWGWWLHHALVSRLKSFHFVGRVGIMTPGSTAVYLNPDSVLRMTMSQVYVLSAALLSSLIFGLISLGKNITVFSC